MGNWKLAPWQEPTTLTRDVLREMRQWPAGRAVASDAHPPLDRRRRRPVAARGHRRHARLPVAQPVARLRRHHRARRHRPRSSGNPAVQGVTLQDGAPAYFSLARTYVQLIDPARGFADGTSTDGAGRDDQRTHALPALPAPGLQAQLLHHELLVRVPVPRLALRPPGHEGQRARPGAAQPGSLRAHHRRRRADGRHVQAHARPAARSRSASPASSPPRSPTGLRVSHDRRSHRSRAHAAAD